MAGRGSVGACNAGGPGGVCRATVMRVPLGRGERGPAWFVRPVSARLRARFLPSLYLSEQTGDLYPPLPGG